MLNRILLGLFALLASSSHAGDIPSASAPQVGLSIIKTSKVTVPEALIYPGGSLSNKVDSNFVAFLIKHGDQHLLFDTGLSSKVDEEYAQDMRRWQQPFFRYEAPVISARQQLDSAGVGPIKQIILSHSHWDHAGGIRDFPDVPVLLPQQEMPLIAQPSKGAGGTWASQVADKNIRWQPFSFKPVAFMGFDASLDLFNDGTVVLVPLFGHTPGSVGLFVTVDSGKRYFLLGDVVWSAKALQDASPKFLPASLIVDMNRSLTQQSIEQIRQLQRQHPEIVMVPAHDGLVHQTLGYFPAWAK